MKKIFFRTVIVVIIAVVVFFGANRRLLAAEELLIAEYSAASADMAGKIHPSIVTLVKRRTVNLGNHSFETESLGSGVLVDKQGYILTNYHNIKKRNLSDISVFTEIAKYAPELVKADEYNDLALLKINGNKSFPFVSVNKKSIKRGNIVFAAGSTSAELLDMEVGRIKHYYIGNVQKGIIVKAEEYLFTDAKVNPGHSGGGLFDSEGALIGITTKRHKEAKIGTAIPAGKISEFLSDTPAAIKNESVGFGGGILEKISREINNVSEKAITVAVQVEAKPKKDDYTEKMMHIAEIAKIYLHRPERIKYWQPASGIIISDDGYIITAYYQVVDYCREISVSVFGKSGEKTVYPAKMIAYDNDFNVNLAILKIEPKEKLPFVDLSELNVEKPKTGNLVFTVGNTLHFERSLTMGIVSNITGGLIQTDAAINNGNLGGSLVDYQGKLVGVIIKRERGLNGVSLALPLKNIIEFLNKNSIDY